MQEPSLSRSGLGEQRRLNNLEGLSESLIPSNVQKLCGDMIVDKRQGNRAHALLQEVDAR